MQQQSYVPTPSAYITPIPCPSCGGKASLMRRAPVPDSPGAELRTFECADCGKTAELRAE